jgi:hypothetical protein
MAVAVDPCATAYIEWGSVAQIGLFSIPGCTAPNRIVQNMQGSVSSPGPGLI